MKDIEKLALCSEMAKKRGSNYELIDISEYYEHQSDELSFHPNGNCGCILLNDSYAFGISCDHLMWAEGQCEGIEYFWTENDRTITKEKWEHNEDYFFNTILVYGNHKGRLSAKLLVFHEPCDN
jgi:hypothetical protein